MPSPVFVRGRWPDKGAVAVVGARRASEAGLEVAEALGRSAAEAGLWVVSGGAIGIDAAAHRGALDGGGRTLAVLGTPLNRPGPRLHRPMFEAIINRGGGWMSEAQGPPTRASFCERNRLIAAMADLVLVVEGQAGSGTRYTLTAARRLDRGLGAVTWAPGDPRGAQAEWVFRRRGTPIWGSEAMLAWFGKRPRRRSARERAAGAPTADEMVESMGLTASEALVRLTQLELEGGEGGEQR